MPSRAMPFISLGRKIAAIFRPGEALRRRYLAFRRLLEMDERTLQRLAELQDHLLGYDPADAARILWLARESVRHARLMVAALTPLDAALAQGLRSALDRIHECIPKPSPWPTDPPFLVPLEQAGGLPQLCGGKACGLGRLAQLGLPVPLGWVLTASAFGHFVTTTGLDEVIRRQLRVARAGNPDAVIRACAAIQEAILATELPDVVLRALERVVEDLGAVPLAVRSSALAEDGEDSFAGQYASELHVLPGDIVQAVRRVYAGKYCPRAVIYRMRRGLTDQDTAMAVLIMPMVEATAAGVLYTQDAGGEDVVSIHGVVGLGSRLMEGQVRPSLFLFSRTDPPQLVLHRDTEATGLSRATVEELARIGLCLEEIWGEALDVEWAVGSDGVVLLQARPMAKTVSPQVENLADAPVLVQGLDPAAPGLACGPVFPAYGGRDFRHIPQGAVVAVPSLAPAISAFLDRAVAIIAEHGSRASHLATVARERGIPVVVGLPPQVIPAGTEVTVDGFQGRVLAGCLVTKSQRPSLQQGSVVWAELAAITVHLTRTDPDAPDFVPEACQSVHDVVRLAHEGGVRAMLELGDRRGRGLGQARRLQLPVPFAVYVLDLGQGIQGDGGEIAMDQVRCPPLRAVLEGLLAEPQRWPQGVYFADWQELDRVAGGLVRRDSRTLASFALVDADFVHLGLRLGYHFSRLDALASSRSEANYVRFSLEGGGGAAAGQVVRLEVVRRILERLDFRTQAQGDRLVAVRERACAADIVAACRHVGRLAAMVRLGDVAWQTGYDVEMAVDQFFAHLGER